MRKQFRIRIQVTKMTRILADPDADPDPQHCTYPHQSDKLDLEPDTDPHQFAE